MVRHVMCCDAMLCMYIVTKHANHNLAAEADMGEFSLHLHLEGHIAWTVLDLTVPSCEPS